jgi:predicted flap endonuclease-1-like 5' DNA nuclease
MGKIDDMRRLREEQHAAKERRGAEAKKAAPPEPAVKSDAPTVAAKPTAPVVTSKPSARGDAKKPEGKDDMGECSGCGKQKPVVNSLVANHQKGFGKMCPGSRKAPV